MKLGIAKQKLESVSAEVKAELMPLLSRETDRNYVFELSPELYRKHALTLGSKANPELTKKVIGMIAESRSRREGKDSPLKSVPHDEWPVWAKAVGLQCNESDAGVGDTIERLAGAAGRTFKAMFKKLTGRPCGCAGRKLKFNRLYPYPQN